ncbi:MAG: carbohydrate kinase family protein [Henriciella sp.]|nr:carbohydrate kinase family protein [Henriciella sp.]
MSGSANSAFVVGGAGIMNVLHLSGPIKDPPQTLFADRSARYVGGTGYGKAVALTHLGLDVVFHATVGPDQAGAEIREALAAKDLVFLDEQIDHPTEVHTNLMFPDGERLSIYHSSPFSGSPTRTEEIGAAARQADITALNIVPSALSLLPSLRRSSATIWVDLHNYNGTDAYHMPFIDVADAVFFSSEALPEFRPFMEQLIAQGKRFAVCTHGAGGATGLTAGGDWHVMPAIPVKTVLDTNGAGDSFFAGFLYAYLREAPFPVCLAYGAAAGATAIEAEGPVSPDLSPGCLSAMIETLEVTI